MNSYNFNTILFSDDLYLEASDKELQILSELPPASLASLNSLFLELGPFILGVEQKIDHFLSKQNLNVQVDVSLIRASTIKNINLETRQLDQVTDVLSFPNFNFQTGQSNDLLIINDYEWLDPEADQGEISLGEILICPLVAKEQARQLGHSLIREICFLYLHGFLHLCGYDHQTEEDSALMFDLQKKLIPQIENLISNSIFEEASNV